jgi:hypothetical protein
MSESRLMAALALAPRRDRIVAAAQVSLAAGDDAGEDDCVTVNCSNAGCPLRVMLSTT